MDNHKINSKIYGDTVKKSSDYTYGDAIKVNLHNPILSSSNTLNPSNSPTSTVPTIYRYNVSLCKLVYTVAHAGFTPLMVVPGCNNDPVPSVKSGYDGIEQDLYRMSNINLATNRVIYPIIDNNHNALHISEFTIFKDEMGKMVPPVQVSALIIPYGNRPRLISYNNAEIYADIMDKTEMIKLYESIFNYPGQHNCLVMSYYGVSNGHPKGELMKIINGLGSNVKWIFICDL